MGREIEGAVQGDFHPMVGIREIGNYVKGKVLEIGATTTGNPFVTLSLIDLEGSTSKSVSKGVYEEVEVGLGDKVQVIGTTKDLKDKLPKLEKGNVVTITYIEDRQVPKGKMKIFKVLVD